MPDTEEAEVSPFSASFARCPYEQFARLRHEQPVFQVPGMPFYLVTRFDDLSAVLTNPAVFRNSREGLEASFQAIGFMPTDPSVIDIFESGLPSPLTLVHTDPPKHTRHRRLISRWFTPRRIEERWASRIEYHVDRLISQFEPDGRVEFMDQFAAPMPNMVLAEILGVDGDRWPDFKRWSDDSVLPLGGQLDQPGWEAHARSTVELQDFLDGVLKSRFAEPSSDLISELAQHVQNESEDERLTELEVVALLVQLLAAGNETTTQLIGNAMTLFAARPDLQEKLHDDPGLIPVAVEEALRLVSPVTGLFRTVYEDTELGGVPIPAGSIVAVMFGSGNHDETEFEAPEEFRLDRPNVQQHLALGKGIHFCVGATLARGEARIAFNRLFARLTEFQIADGQQPRDGEPSFMLRSLVELPLQFRSRSDGVGAVKAGPPS